MNRILATIFALALSSPAWAATATITRIDGNVLVNQGEQFVPAQPGQLVNTGDRLMVPQGGFSSLTFEDGCVLDVQPNTLITIPADSNCEQRAAAQQPTPNTTTVGTRPYAVGTRPFAGDSLFGWSAIASIVAITIWKISEGDEDDDDTASP